MRMSAPVRWSIHRVFFAVLLAASVVVAHEERFWHPPKDTRSPQDIMVDVVNDLGLNILKIHNTNNENNIAISPYGVASILTALLEGTKGRAAIEIQKCGGFPADRDIVRVGLRDIHRLLRSYFIPQEGFLSGLSLSTEKVTLKPEFQSVLRFYGYDMESFNTPIYPNIETTTPMNNMTTIFEDKIPTETETTQTTSQTETSQTETTQTTSQAETTQITTSQAETTQITTSPPETTQTTTSQTETTQTTTEEVLTVPTTTNLPTTTTAKEETTLTTESTIPTTTEKVETTTILTTTSLPDTTTQPKTTENVEIIMAPETETTMTTQPKTTGNEEITMTTEPGTTMNLETISTTFPADSTTGETTVTETTILSTTTENPETTTLRMRISRSLTDYFARFYDDHTSDIYNEPVNDKHSFLVNSKYQETHVHFMTYDAVLPFYYVHNLNALALRFPLDSPKYYLLLVLPVDEEGIDKLICDIGNAVTLKQIVSHMRPTYVRAVIPSFMLRGFVILTSSLQKIGIRQIFEPRRTDFSPMTDDKDIYVTNIEQAITVMIKNYMDPTMINKHRNLYQYGPVEFKATHPFLYFVMDSEVDVALVAGKIVNPINSRIQ